MMSTSNLVYMSNPCFLISIWPMSLPQSAPPGQWLLLVLFNDTYHVFSTRHHNKPMAVKLSKMLLCIWPSLKSI
ncbi:hypothetical protein CPC08DRAFT_701783 [Agrocybe pediades]|nr:hypothetical protein CPC08DRAFT_701783 [Agrocybe pediades]